MRLLMFSRVLLAAAPPLSAATYCVTSVATSDSAMSSATSGDEGTVQGIRIRPGTYNPPAGLDFDPAGDQGIKDFSITGGWNSGCSARTVNAGATVLNAENGATDGSFGFSGNHERFVIEGLRFINFGSFGVNDLVAISAHTPNPSLIVHQVSVTIELPALMPGSGRRAARPPSTRVPTRTARSACRRSDAR